MLMQLKCKSCGSNLKRETGLKYFICEACDSRYVFADEDEIIDVKELISKGQKALKEGDYDEALDDFELYVEECGLPDYEAYLGYILASFECRTMKQLSKVAYAEAFEVPEWKILIEVAGEHKDELLAAKAESKENFKKKMQTMVSRKDAEVVNSQALYLMYIAQHRQLEDADDIRQLAGKDEFFETLHSFYIIPCTAKNKPAEFYLPAIKRAGNLVRRDMVMVIPEPDESMKDELLEEMYECHMSNKINLVLVFLKDIKQIERIYRYSNCTSYNCQYDVPTACFCNTESYLQGNQLILLGGDKRAADTVLDSDSDKENNEADEGIRCEEEELRGTREQNEREKKEKLRKFTAILEAEKKAREEKERKEKEAAIEQRAAWIRARKCRHCGGIFSGGIFSKRCSVCGKRKDY